MYIKDFENNIDSNISKLGFDFFKQDLVSSIVVDDGEYTATFSDSVNCFVKLKISIENEILLSECNCEESKAAICKHQVAVLYELRNILQNKPGKKTKKIVWNKLLLKQNKKVLADIITDLIKNNPELKSKIILDLNNTELQIINYSTDLINSALEIDPRFDLISQKESENIISAANRILRTIDKNSENYELSLKLCIVILKFYTEIYSFSNYLSNSVFEPLSKTLTKISEIVENVISNDDLNTTVSAANELLKFFKEYKIIYLYSWLSELFELYLKFMDIPQLRLEYLSYLENVASINNSDFNQILDVKMDYYASEFAQALIIKILKSYNSEEEVYDFMNKHLENPRFRDIIIKKSMESKNFDYALALCKEAEKIDKDSRANLEWKRIRYSIYEQQNDIENCKSLALIFIYNSEFEYFLKLKELSKGDDWNLTVDNILLSLEKEIFYRPIYFNILIEERRFDKLMNYCKKRPLHIDRYYSYLIDDYPNEVDDVFVEKIMSEGARASSQSGVKNICKLLRLYKKAFSADKAKEIKNRLLEQNAKQKNLVLEIEKLKLI